MNSDKNQTCFWCHEQRSVDQDGRIAYHDYPVPCRMLCSGSRWPSVERIAATAPEFENTVGDYLERASDLGMVVPDRAKAMCIAFEQDRDWPRRLVSGLARPHPLLREAIVKWIGEQLRKERSGEAG